MRRVTFPIMFLAVLAMMAVSAFAGETAKKAEKKADHVYVGAKKCKMCHKAQYESWSKTAHADAFSKLSAEEQKNPECVKCHITGTTAKDVVLENVQCEACHGPGKDYKSPKIMNKKKWKADPKKHKQMAIDAGLIYPSEKDCVRCHTKEGNTHFKPFDFEKRKPEVHAMKATKAAKKSAK